MVYDVLLPSANVFALPASSTFSFLNTTTEENNMVIVVGSNFISHDASC